MLTLIPHRPSIPAAGGISHFAARIVAPAANALSPRPPLDIALILDRSGSMGADDKIDLAKRAVLSAIDLLGPRDQFAIIAYDNEVDVVVASGPASREAKQAARVAVDALQPRGGTDLHGGWQRGAEEVAQALTAQHIGKCIVVTDGRANQGVTDREALVRLATTWRSAGVLTSTFGIGIDFDENLLAPLADAGGGAFWYIERPERIATALAAELQDTLEITARDIDLELTCPAATTIEVLGSVYPVTKVEAGVFRIRLPDLASRQELDAILAVEVAAGMAGETISIGAKMRDREMVMAADSIALWLPRILDTLAAAECENAEVGRRILRFQQADVVRRAGMLAANGDQAAAGRVLATFIDGLAKRARDDAFAAKVSDELEEVANAYFHGDLVTMKQSFSTSSNILRSRASSGESRRSQ